MQLSKYIAAVLIAASFVIHLAIYQWEWTCKWFGYCINDDQFHKWELFAFSLIWWGIYALVENRYAKPLCAFIAVIYLLSLNKEFFLDPHQIYYQDYYDLLGGLVAAILEGAGFFTMIKNRLLAIKTELDLLWRKK